VFGNGYTVIYLNGPPAGAEVTVTVCGATCAAEVFARRDGELSFRAARSRPDLVPVAPFNSREGTASSIDSGDAPKP
jgi:hypothetical protein